MLPAFPASLTLCFGHLPAVLFAGSRGCYRTLVRLFQRLSSSLLLSLLLQISHFLLEEMLHVSFLLQIYHQLPMDATNTCPSLWRASRINFTSHTSNDSFPERLWWCLCCDVCCSVWLRSDMIHCSKWQMWQCDTWSKGHHTAVGVISVLVIHVATPHWQPYYAQLFNSILSLSGLLHCVLISRLLDTMSLWWHQWWHHSPLPH